MTHYTNESIHLFKRFGYWMARYSDPLVFHTFGKDTLMLPYDSTMDGHAVLIAMQTKRPLAQLTIES